jgi:flagellar motility protein MotE (MotC chaperone)
VKNGYNDFFKSIKENKGTSGRPSTPQGTKSHSASRPSVTPKREQAKRRRQKFPIVGILCLGAMISLTALYLTDPSIVERIGKNIEIGFISKSEAAEENKAQSGDAKGEKSSPEKSTAANEPAEKSASEVPEDGSYIKKLNERKNELDRKEVSLNELEAELHKQRLEIEERIKQLEQLRGSLAGMLQDKVEVDDEKVGKLVEFYSNMKPKQAADIISTVNEDLAVEILGRMKKKNAAEILNLLPPKKAQMFSERYAGYTKK